MQIEYLVVVYVILLFSLCVHEFAHAWSANMCGDDTARLLGRMSLNPIVHIDPLGTVIFPLLMMVTGTPFLFGWAKPVPVNPGRFHDYKRDDIIVSLSGIISNLLLALIAATTLRTVLMFGGFGFVRPLVFILQYMMIINVVLAVFNIIPIPPLDGSHVLFHYLPPDAALQFRRLERYGFILLIVFLMTGVFSMIVSPPLQLFYFIAGI
jgi:Zn-dependent protease